MTAALCERCDTYGDAGRPALGTGCKRGAILTQPFAVGDVESWPPQADGTEAPSAERADVRRQGMDGAEGRPEELSDRPPEHDRAAQVGLIRSHEFAGRPTHRIRCWQRHGHLGRADAQRTVRVPPARRCAHEDCRRGREPGSGCRYCTDHGVPSTDYRRLAAQPPDEILQSDDVGSASRHERTRLRPRAVTTTGPVYPCDSRLPLPMPAHVELDALGPIKTAARSCGALRALRSGEGAQARALGARARPRHADAHTVAA